MLSKDMVPLYESLVWIIFWCTMIILFRKSFLSIVEALKKRIIAGASFSLGPMSIGEPPNQLNDKGPNTVVVSDKGELPTLNNTNLSDQLNEKYNLYKNQYFVLHASEIVTKRTAPRTGRYRVRIWLESYIDPKLEKIEKVTYRLWDDFHNPTISTKSSKSNFDVWLSVYGEFPVLVLIEIKDGDPIWLSSYIDLPERPPD